MLLVNSFILLSVASPGEHQVKRARASGDPHTPTPDSEDCEPLACSACRPEREVRVELQGSELWNRFYEIGTEMIITKAGR